MSFRGLFHFILIKPLFADDKQEAAAWLAFYLNRKLLDIGDLPWLVGRISKHAGINLLPADETKVCIKSHRLICTVDSGNIPHLSASAGKHCADAWISAHISCLIPGSRELAKEILHLLRLREETLRTVGKMLEAALEKHCEREFVSV